MPANDFLQVGHVSPPAMLSQAAWAALAQRSAGWAAGVLPPEHYNKALRQHAAVSAMIGEFIKTIGGLDALDDANNAVLLANFIASLDARIIGAGTSDISTFKTVTSAPVTAPPGSPAAGDEVLVADSPSGGFAGQARKLARYTGSAWAFTTVRPGRVFRVNNTSAYWQLDAAAGWQSWSGVPTAWGAISGTLSAQTDLHAALDAKVAKAGDTMTGALNVTQLGGIGVNVYGAGPQYIQVVNTAVNGAYIQIGAGLSDAYLGTFSNTELRLVQNSATRAKLVSTGVRMPAAMGLFFENAGGTYTNGSAGVRVLPSGGNLYIENYEAGSTIFGRAGSAETMRLGPAGQIGIAGANYGASAQVVRSNGSGAAASWANVNDLIDLPTLKTALGLGKKIIAVGAGPGAVTFAAAEADTNYFIAGVGGIISNTAVNETTTTQASMSGKTTTGCSVGFTTGSGGSGTGFVWIIYR